MKHSRKQKIIYLLIDADEKISKAYDMLTEEERTKCDYFSGLSCDIDEAIGEVDNILKIEENKMKVVQAFESEDGKLFLSSVDCIEHECWIGCGNEKVQRKCIKCWCERGELNCRNVREHYKFKKNVVVKND